MGSLDLLLRAFIPSVTIYSLYLLGKAIYNVTLHPLAKIPGTWMEGAFLFPWHWHRMRGTAPARNKELHDRYGAAVRISPDRLTFNTSQAWRDIHAHKKGKKDLIRDPQIFTRPKQTLNIIFSSEADHTRMRRLLQHSFSDSALRSQEPLIHKYCDLLVSRLHSQIKKPIDITRWFNFTTFDIIGDLAFSEPFQALEKGVYHKWMSTIFKSLKLATLIDAVKLYPPINVLLPAIMKQVPSTVQAKLDHENYTKEKVTRRLENNADQKDFVSHILQYNDGKGMTNEEIISNSEILILAGSETSATLLSGLTFLLLKNPHILAKFASEIRSHFKFKDEMTFINETKLPYLHACIEEALRIYPPAPGISPFLTQPEGLEVDGTFVPGNLRLSIDEHMGLVVLMV